MTLQDLPLFAQPSTSDDKLLRQWRECRRANPWLMPKLAEMAIEAKRCGFGRWSADALFHVLRWETRHSTGIDGLGLKVNNNYTALAARDLMREYPELDGFFKTRERKARGNFGQMH